jgi:hypothetical protein
MWRKTGFLCVKRTIAALCSLNVNESPQTVLNGLSVAAFFSETTSGSDAPGKPAKPTTTADIPIAVGKIKSQISSNIYAVTFSEISLSPVIEVGSRVFIQLNTTPPNTPGGGASEKTKAGPTAFGPHLPGEEPVTSTIICGLVAKVNGNGTFGILLDDERFEPAVVRSRIVISEGRSKIHSNALYEAIVEWVRSAGVEKRSDQESTSCILFHRGWRADKLYLLENQDVHCLSHLNKSVRMSLLEKADWEREHHRQRRDISKERLKEKDWRYVLTKYSGVFSATVACFAACSVFMWNFKNYKKSLRGYQLDLAVETLKECVAGKVPIDHSVVRRDIEEARFRGMMRRMDLQHPRVVVYTGQNGCGKSLLCRQAATLEGFTTLFVEVRGTEDPMRAIVKALGVQNVEVCGDLMDFMQEVVLQFKRSQTVSLGMSSPLHVTPLIVLKLRDGNLQRIYNEAVALACDRRLCHLFLEVPIEKVTIANTSLPRLDYYFVPNFTAAEAVRYTQHLIDPLHLEYFINVVGTNSNDLDELIAATQTVRNSATGTPPHSPPREAECRGTEVAVQYTNKKLIKAMRQLEHACGKDLKLMQAVMTLARHNFGVGQRAVFESTLKSEALKDIVYYNAVEDGWMFSSKVFFTAARVLGSVVSSEPDENGTHVGSTVSC